MSTTQVQIASLTAGTPSANSVLICETPDGLQTFRCKAGEVAGLGGAVSSVNGATGAVSLNATSVGAAAASHGHTTGNISNFASEVVTIAAAVAATASPVLSVNGLTGAVSIGSGDVSSVNGATGAVSLNATSVGAAPSTHGSVHARTGSDPIQPVAKTIAALTQNENAIDLSGADIVYMSAATTDREIRGFTGSTTGWPIVVVNSGTTFNLIVKHAHTSAATSDRVLTPWSGDYVISPNWGAMLRAYDTAESRNRAL